MKKLSGLILLFLYLLPVFRPIFPFIEYSVNKNYIISKLCINRENPEMQCNGKCYLMKELKKAIDESAARRRNSILAIEINKYPVIIHPYLVDISPLWIKFSPVRFPYTVSFTNHVISPPTPPPKQSA